MNDLICSETEQIFVKSLFLAHSSFLIFFPLLFILFSVCFIIHFSTEKINLDGVAKAALPLTPQSQDQAQAQAQSLAPELSPPIQHEKIDLPELKDQQRSIKHL